MFSVIELFGHSHGTRRKTSLNSDKKINFKQILKAELYKK